MRNSFLFFVPLSALFFSCKNAEVERGDEEEVVSKVSKRTKKNFRETDIVLPEGYRVKASGEGLNFSVDTAFDEDKNYRIAEAGYPTYGIRQPHAAKLRILKVGTNKKPNILFNQMASIVEVRKQDSSESVIRLVTGA
ncbi:hypothetical protein SAMN06296241_1231 [Salinimicrobium sediminis]|uniref:Uncharacterized protein n=1 Tax=Salinimicrobium sediminis TaxID=1343891 RepID=A0A285X5L5_9FLAO|nr:hypothetical protein [Salinimicrobium sediminis]SOC79699.1 hypothetical protein SAMN06296241_1231 [Salinimicrobium sediminis]